MSSASDEVGVQVDAISAIIESKLELLQAEIESKVEIESEAEIDDVVQDRAIDGVVSEEQTKAETQTRKKAKLDAIVETYASDVWRRWHVLGWETSVLNSLSNQALTEICEYHSLDKEQIDLKQCLLNDKWKDDFIQYVMITIVLKKRLTGARVTYSKDFDRIKRERIEILKKFRGNRFGIGSGAASGPSRLEQIKTEIETLFDVFSVSILAESSTKSVLLTRLQNILSDLVQAYKKEEQDLEQVAKTLAFYCGSRSEALFESKSNEMSVLLSQWYELALLITP